MFYEIALNCESQVNTIYGSRESTPGFVPYRPYVYQIKVELPAESVEAIRIPIGESAPLREALPPAPPRRLPPLESS